ncbi:MAG: hypothetical protein U9R75_10305 [Candidatus Thermoplasmatota archaeon]|nr:hypothetical protein [Candidatus Thermoplasmatota archaeon]
MVNMTGVARCQGCGEYASEIWGRKDVCPSCGGKLLREDVEMPLSRIPRVLNIFGILAMLFVMVIFIYLLAGSAGSGTPRVIMVIVAVLAGVCFLSSLALQYKLESNARIEHSTRFNIRKKRKLRVMDNEMNRIRKGSVKRRRPRGITASKIPIRK